MRVVITGGSGLIGRALALDLEASGYEVVIVSRRPGALSGLSSRVRVIQWEGLREASDGAFAIVNLAGENIASGRWTKSRKHRIRKSRLDAGRAVVEAVGLARQRPKVVVQASAVGYYGQSGETEVTEDSPPGQDFLARLAVEWEASTKAVEEMGVRRVVLRTGLVLSPRGGALPRLALPFRLFLGGPLGDGHQWVPWIHIRDEVRAIRFLMENDSTSGPYNLVAPRPVTNREMAKALGQVLSRPSWLPVPAFLLRLLLGEMAQVLLTGQRAVPRRLLEAKFSFIFEKLDDALEDLFAKAW